MSGTSDGSKSAQPAPQSPQKRWQFIDASNDSSDNLTQVKRHVMQEYMRQKRREAQRRDGAGDAQAEGKKSQQKKRQRQKRTQAGKASGTPSDEKDSDRSGIGKQKGKAVSAQDDTQTQDVGPERSTGADDIEEIDRSFAAGAFDYGPPADPLFASSTSGFLPDAVFSRIQSSASDSRSSSPWSSYPASPPLPSPTPKTILSAARTDPFDSLPVKLNMEEQKLFDFYVNEMPACSYGTLIRSPKAHNWYTAVFVPEAMKGAVAFQNTIIVHAANTWAWIRNETETENTLIHRGRAISMLRKHLAKNPKDISDAAIIACMSAAALEDFDPRPGHKEISWMHWRAAREMIRNRGGPAAFENTRLAMLINWQDYILAGYETNGPSFFFEHNPESLSSMPSPPYSTSSASSGHIPSSPTESYYLPRSRQPLSPIEEIQYHCEAFISFLKRCEHLAIHQRTTPPKTSAPTRHTAFQTGSLLYRILASPPGRRFTSTGDRKQIISRQASLMMLNAALWDYRFSIHRTEVFLKSLIMKVLESEVDMTGSVEALLQILLACKDGFTDEPETMVSSPGSSSEYYQDAGPDFSQYSPTATSASARPWFIGRMLKVAKRLGLESWERLSDVLFSCLTLQVQEPVVPSWEHDLRREILEAPLTSYVMPALQSRAC
ncbi:sigma-70 region 2 family protein [Thermoascus aurantiacus ATCC 26904]